MSGPVAITAFVVAIIVSIMIHELGHLLTARWSGIKADRFFLGFGPTLWSTQRGETEYGIKAIPLGGFVRICGMSPLDERDPPIVDVVFPDGEPPEPGHWDRLATHLRRRGASRALTDRIVRRTRASLGIGRQDQPAASDPHTDPRDVLREVIVTEVPESRRHGDLRHRLLLGDQGRFFHDRPASHRAIVLVSGALTHFVLVFVVLLAAYALIPQWTGGFDNQVAEVIEGGPAAQAGLEPGDRLVQVGDVRTTDYVALRDAIRAHPDQPTTLVVIRADEQLELPVVPDATQDGDEVVGTVGFAPELERQRFGPIEAVEHALIGQPQVGSPGGLIPMFTGSLRAFVTVFSPEGIGNIFAQATGAQPRDAQGAVSLIGAASIAGQVADGALGLMMFIGLFAAVNVFIGIFNLVPLPPLDGGHLAMLVVERSVNAFRRARGRAADFKLDERIFAGIAIPVMAGLLVLMGLLLWLDIRDPIRF